MPRYLLSDPTDDVQQVLHTDACDETRGAIQIVQNVDGVLETVRKFRENGADSKTKELRHLAEVPMAVYLRACQEGWANDQKAWKRWMNDPDNRAFRVNEGRA